MLMLGEDDHTCSIKIPIDDAFHHLVEHVLLGVVVDVAGIVDAGDEVLAECLTTGDRGSVIWHAG